MTMVQSLNPCTACGGLQPHRLEERRGFNPRLVCMGPSHHRVTTRMIDAETFNVRCENEQCGWHLLTTDPVEVREQAEQHSKTSR